MTLRPHLTCVQFAVIGVLLCSAAVPHLHAQPGGFPDPQPVTQHAFDVRPVNPYESDILTARPIRWHVGLAVGGSAFQHVGSFSPACDCLFGEESGARFHYGAEVSMHVPKVGIGARLMVDYMEADAAFVRTERRLAELVGDDPAELMDFENTSTVQLSWLALTPAFTYTWPFTSLFLYGGVEIGIPLSARYNHVERILTPGYLYDTGETTNTLLAETDIPGGKRVRLALALGMGVDIPVVGSFSIMPRAGISYPLTTVSSSDALWKVMTEHLVLVLRWRLK